LREEELSSFCLVLIIFFDFKKISFFDGETELVCRLIVDSLAFIIFFESVVGSFKEASRLFPDNLKLANFLSDALLLDVSGLRLPYRDEFAEF
jgi:hypothetical protein